MVGMVAGRGVYSPQVGQGEYPSRGITVTPVRMSETELGKKASA